MHCRRHAVNNAARKVYSLHTSNCFRLGWLHSISSGGGGGGGGGGLYLPSVVFIVKVETS